MAQWEWGALLLHVLSTYFLVRLLLRPTSRVGFLLGSYLVFTLLIVAGGQVLSSLNLFGDIRAWFGLNAAILAIVTLTVFLYPQAHSLAFARSQWFGSRGGARLSEVLQPRALLFLVPAIVLAGILGAQVYLIATVAPRNWDSLTCHLSRMGFYLQQGNLEPFPTTWEAMIVHPTAGVCLHAYAFLISGRVETMTQAVNGLSYLTSILAIYGTCRLLGCRRIPSAVAGTVFGLLTICMLQAVSTQTDMQFAGWVAIAIYQLAHFSVHRRTRDLVIAAVAATLPLGIKSSAFLVLPALGLMALYSASVETSFARRIRSLLIFSLSAAAAFLLFVAPLGYIGNISRFGHPMGSSGFRRMHSFEGRSLSEVLQFGSTNILRYGLSFARLDGQPAPIAKWEESYLRPIHHGIESLGIKLDNPDACRIPIWPYYDCLVAGKTCEDASWWGILGVLLVWPCVFWALCAPGMSPAARVLAGATFVFLLTQCFSGPYDPWRGRYFIHGALFAVPCVGLVVETIRSRISIGVVTAILCVGLFSGVTTTRIQLQASSPMGDRTAEMLTRNPALLETVRQYEKVVPPGSKVAIRMMGDTYLYPFFGARLDRELHSTADLKKPGPPAMGDADFFLYTSRLAEPAGEDIPLGNNLYLRDLRRAQHSADGSADKMVR